MADSIAFTGTRPQATNCISVTTGWGVEIRGETAAWSVVQLYIGFGTAATAPTTVSDLAHFTYESVAQGGNRLQLLHLIGGVERFVLKIDQMPIAGAIVGGDPAWVGIIGSSSNPTGTDVFLAVAGPIDVLD